VGICSLCNFWLGLERDHYAKLSPTLSKRVIHSYNIHLLCICSTGSCKEIYGKEFLLLWAKAISLDPKVLSREERLQLFQAHAFVTASGVKSLEAPALLERDESTLKANVHNSQFVCKTKDPVSLMILDFSI
jgi:hypothetical protein